MDILNETLLKLKKLENEIERLKTIERGGVWTNYTPTVTYAGGTTDPTSITKVYAKYSRIGNVVHVALRYTYVVGSGDRTTTLFTLPVSAKTTLWSVICWERINTGNQEVKPAWINTSTQLIAQHGTMAVDQHVTVFGTYEVE
jgi:hypothetical protein